MKALKRAIMKVARSRIGGVLASFCVRRCLCLLPVKVEASSAEFVMMRHPRRRMWISGRFPCAATSGRGRK